MMLRFHAQTAGSTLTAQQPGVNVVRESLDASAWPQYLADANRCIPTGADEAPGIAHARIGSPGSAHTTESSRYESGVVTREPIPCGGSRYIEELTDRIEAEAVEYIDRIDGLGGTLAAIEKNYVQMEIQNAAYQYQQEIETGERVIVGVNRFQQQEVETMRGFRLDPASEQQQVARLHALRSSRDAPLVDRRLAGLEGAARGSENLMPHFLSCCETLATVGEISDRLRRVFGEYREP
jgi:methylmalonyl-CoA mutase N-terminal domain/subunit